MRAQITLGEVLDAHGFALLAGISKISVGLVTAYHASVAGKSPPSVDVQPAVHDIRWDTELGTRISEPWPILPAVPIAFPKFGGYAITGPMLAGDVVLLLSFDLDPTAFQATKLASDPVDTRRHGGGYWIAIPCDITDAGALTDPGKDLVIGQPGGVQVRLNGSGVSIGAAAPSDAVALASVVDKFIQAVMSWVPVPNDGGLALKTKLSGVGVGFSPTSSSASGTVKVTP